jgi:hypothetical protein
MNKFEALQILGLTGEVSNEDIKLAYKHKAKEYHPDRNPAGAEVMKMINVAYDVVKNESDLNVFENQTMADYPEALATALNAILALDLTIEICGLWIWVSGDTKLHKEALKEAGYRWAPKKKMWYYRPNQAKSRKYRCNNKSEWDMNKIRETYDTSTPRKQSFLAAH